MTSYSLCHVPDGAVLPNLARAVSHGCANTAIVLAYISEADERRLYAPAGYESIHAYLVEELHFSEDSAGKRIHAARTARRFPMLFEAVARGHLHLSAVCMLAAHVDESNAAGLIAAATHKSKSQIALLLAERFPKEDVPTRIRSLPQARCATLELQHAPGHVHVMPNSSTSVAPTHECSEHAPGHVAPPARPAKVAPLAPERFAVQLTISKSTRDKLRRAQDLLSHSLPSGDVAQVLDRALDALIEQLEKRKFAATSLPRRCKGSTNSRYIAADVRRAVHERDGDQCTFVNASGKRCEARRLLEYDHVTEVARGGLPTVDGLRLRCRAHNQYTAERAFGAEFMRRKREARATG